MLMSYLDKLKRGRRARRRAWLRDRIRDAELLIQIDGYARVTSKVVRRWFRTKGLEVTGNYVYLSASPPPKKPFPPPLPPPPPPKK